MDQNARTGPQVEHLFFEAHDGTRIAYQKVGQGRPVVLSNGLGGTFAAWKHLYTRLAPRWKVLCWDYRGLYGSGPPPSSDSVRMEHHCRDLDKLMEVEEVTEAVFMGWSMGTQVNFEFYRNAGDRFKGLVLLNGTYGRPFSTALGGRFMDQIIPAALKLMELGAPVVSTATRRLTELPALVPALQALGLVGETLDMDIFRELAGEFSRLDFQLYSRTLSALGDHDAEDVLERVACPTLVITGDKDLMTPVSTAEEIQRRVSDCRLEVLTGATHYAAVEFPDRVGDLVEGFLTEIGYTEQ